MIKFILFIFLMAYLNLNTLLAREIYKWVDEEGIKQFSYQPPPLNCQTSSCIKLYQQLSKKVRQKKEIARARIEAEQQMQRQMQLEAKKQRKEDKKQKNIISFSSSTNVQSKDNFLAFGTVICVSLKNIREYTRVSQARKYLEQDQLCQKVTQETEFTLIEKSNDFSNIRIYKGDGGSQQKWVENRVISD